ncbi:unnamed protein product [Paramecium pentaurelia]|uniref:Uncharacterized protein n=1 Tax=Paramecium pentaurelia TaxID=43138 RepID=A0A8S1X908_9CILI|nr:unnamed protein product [Paramecium pentaurelia]
MKILDQIKQEVEHQMQVKYGKSISKRYNKATITLRWILIYMVLILNKTIKQSSELLGINYTAAKNIYRQYKNIQLNQNIQRRAGVSSIENYNWKKFKVIVICQNTQTHTYTLDLYIKK